MRADRNKPGVACWATVVVVAVLVLVAYPLAWGPWLWLKPTYSPPGWICSAGDAAFAPLSALKARRLLPVRYLIYIEDWQIAAIERNAS